MFRLHSIRLINFKSFIGAHKFEFPDKSGLYFLSGQNKVDDIGGNGAGKSSFIDAIVWCLYGQTARGLKATDILNWDVNASASVTLEVTIGYHFIIKRTQKPNGLYIDDKPVDQTELQKHIRLNYESFMHSVLNAQFGTSFFSLTPSAKLSLFSDIMELDYWLDKSKLATEMATEIQTSITSLEKQVVKMEERKSLQTMTIEELEKLSTDYDHTRAEGINALERSRENNLIELNRIESEITRLETERKYIENRRVELKLRLAKKRSEVNPYIAQLNEKRRNLSETVAKLKTLNIDLEESMADHAACSFWGKGFRRVRLFIIEQTFRTLELEVNNCLAQLGLPDWQITFDIERENKSGGVTKGFTVFVKSPKNKEPVKWESWSGGETQRLQLAGDLGLANLIMQQSGLDNSVEFFDEPTTHLSKEGMLDLADMLHVRSITENKTIWIVDHSEITNFGDFAGVITVLKDKNGSRITVQKTGT